MRTADFPSVDTGLGGTVIADDEYEFEEVSEEEFVRARDLLVKEGLIEVFPSEFTQFAFFLPSKVGFKPFSFTGRRYMRQIYDTDAHRQLLLAARQVEKSTLLGNRMLTYCCLNVGFRYLYVSPSNQQTKTFSKDRIQEPIETSKYLKAFTNSRLTSNIFEKSFVNHSKLTLRFAYLNADRTRGVPADGISIDELQDILLDNIPVIEECASHSEWGIFTYSGTPKSLDNAIEYYWSKLSTQNEWAVPCRHHGTPNDPSSWHWNVLQEQHIGRQGPICERCGNRLDPDDEDAQWACHNPSVRPQDPDDEDESKKIFFEGFRIPQLMVPWVISQWAKLLYKYEHYPRARFYNEVLGRSFDSGTRPLTQHDVLQNSNPKLSMRAFKQVRDKYAATIPIVAGIDWGGDSDDSYTLLTLGGYMPWAPSLYSIFYAKRFVGQDSDSSRCLEVVFEIIDYFNCRFIGVDYGNGQWPNSQLIRRYGHERVKKYQWVATMKHKIAWEPKMGRYLVHRTEVMTDVFAAIKRGNVFQFPMWDEWSDPFASDMLNIFSEFNEKTRTTQYMRPPGMPDDTFHSLSFGFLASMHMFPRPDIITPNKVMDDESMELTTFDDLDIGPEKELR